jgi:preprotein translocase subunit SecB
MTHYDPAAEMLLGYIQCRIWMNKASDKTLETKPSLDEAFEKSLFSISAKYFVAFKIEGSHEKGCVDSFYERTAPFTAWPYFRALVAQLAAAANLEIPVLPIKRVLVPFKSGGGYTRADAATD